MASFRCNTDDSEQKLCGEKEEKKKKKKKEKMKTKKKEKKKTMNQGKIKMENKEENKEKVVMATVSFKCDEQGAVLDKNIRLDLASLEASN